MAGAAIYTRLVEFAETDAAGMVHFSVFFRYMEEAEHAVWRKAGMDIYANHEERSWPRISAKCDFKSPLRFQDEFEVRTEIAAVSRSTIQWAHTLVRGETILRIAAQLEGLPQRAGRRRQLIPGAVAYEDGIVEKLAELLQRVAHRRLGDALLLGGARDVRFLEERVEVHEEVEVHGRQVQLAHRRHDITFRHGADEELSLATQCDPGDG